MPALNAIRRAITWITLGLVGAALFGVAGQWFIQVATDKGWYAHAGQTWDNFVIWVLAILASPIVRYAAYLALGVSIGMWFSFWLSRKEKQPVQNLLQNSKELEVVSNKEFHNEVINLSGKKYINCKFFNVTLNYNGGSYSLDRNEFFGTPVFRTDNGDVWGLAVLLMEIYQVNMTLQDKHGKLKRSTTDDSNRNTQTSD